MKLAGCNCDQARKRPDCTSRRVAQQQAIVTPRTAALAAARHVLARRSKLAKSTVITVPIDPSARRRSASWRPWNGPRPSAWRS